MKTFLTLLLLTASQFILAQTVTVTGTVKDHEGDPLHFAFVQDKQYKTAAYTDSLGHFALNVMPNSTLKINCVGYKDTLISVKNRLELSIILSEAVNISASDHKLAADANAKTINMAKLSDDMNLIKETNPAASAPHDVAVKGAPGHTTISVRPETIDMAQGSIFPVFNPKEETKGSRYFFSNWVHGYVIDSKDSVIQNPLFLFNYDKMGGGLLLTRDSHSAIEVNKEQVKSFTLYNTQGEAFTFARVPEIDPTHYVQVIASGNKYKIYKTIKTKLEKANFTSDGVMSSGNNYDEYVNEEEYYVLNLQTNQTQKLFPKKKALKAYFANEGDKLNKFFADNSPDTIDDSYLSNLGTYMNE